jgi:hypothetical protein
LELVKGRKYHQKNTFKFMPKRKILSAIVLVTLALPFSVALATETLPWAAATPGLTLPTVAIERTVLRVANVIFYLLALIAFIMVVWGGIVMATAAGDPAKVDLARHMIMYALIAIAVGAISWGLVNLVATYVGGVRTT